MAPVRAPCDSGRTPGPVAIRAATSGAWLYGRRRERLVSPEDGMHNGTVLAVLEHDEARALVVRGLDTGFLTYTEIAAAVEDLELEAADAEELLQTFDELQIEILDRPDSEAERPALEIAPEVKEISTDALQLFLKDIGRVPLLTPAQEVELAKRIERGDMAAKRKMV